MPNEQASKPDAKMRLPGTKLNGWWRFIAAVLAFAGLGSGGVAVYTTKVEAGPVALIAVGLIFFLVAASGRLPTRLKYGENEAVWEQAAERFVTELVPDEVSAEQTPELLSTLSDLAEVAPAAAAAGINALSEARAYERFVVNMVFEAAAQLGTAGTRLAVSRLSEALRETGFDLQIAYGTKLVFVDIRYRIKPIGPSTVMEIWGRAGMAAHLADRDRIEVGPTTQVDVLLISNQPLSQRAIEIARSAQDEAEAEGIRHVVINGPDDMPQLVEALRASISPGS